MAITIKTEEDIEVLREGGKILATILDELEKVAQVGNTTLDIDDRAMELIEEYGVEPMTLGYQPSFAPRPYPAATCVSINDVLVHGIPNEEPVVIQDGDLVSIDVVIAYDGMVLDSARTVGVGNVSPEAQQLLDVTRKALSVGIDAAKPGHFVSDIGAAIEKVVPKKFGIVEAFAGHGVGYELHEDPEVPNFKANGPSVKLEPGMVIAIEPMITLGDKDVEIMPDGYTVITADGSWSAHMEHTVVITKDGPEILTIK